MHIELSFRQLQKEELPKILPLMQKFTQNKHSDELLSERFSEMFQQNYECIGVFNDRVLIGICGLWFCTRHYSGRSIEVDHVYIDDLHRSKGIGKQLFAWIYAYANDNGYEAVELNTYVQNHPSHKFYYNEGFNILGYHFVKKM